MPSPEEMQNRYANLIDAEDKAMDEQLPPMAREREEEALKMANTVREAARELLAKGQLVAVGYRVMVKPLDAIKGLELAEAEVAPLLHEAGFEVKSDAEKKREERGENHGIVMSLGPVAFDRMGGREAWCDEGDVVVFSRYAGTRVEHPRGSGKFFQLMNDEDIFGKVI